MFVKSFYLKMIHLNFMKRIYHELLFYNVELHGNMELYANVELCGAAT
jgi:hypothetical protein